MKKIEKMIHQIIRFRGNIEAFLVSIEEFSRSSLNSVLNVKELEGAFNQEKALGAFSVIVQLRRLIVYSSNCNRGINSLVCWCEW